MLACWRLLGAGRAAGVRGDQTGPNGTMRDQAGPRTESIITMKKNNVDRRRNQKHGEEIQVKAMHTDSIPCPGLYKQDSGPKAS